MVTASRATTEGALADFPPAKSERVPENDYAELRRRMVQSGLLEKHPCTT